ncbi:hypothetical protein GGQ22_01510 [Nocardioides sp. zg-579]|uniref:Fumarylacetoacetase-like C-terminal domain-containing protein n=1 Tax=Nocardioides marmotae TaxID=2663857 RepID=A0A6I3IYK6_9ACTN|nr:fumarylacetoacetate hydrolase family protein [Nocardioides marmotae]MCR6030120.1 hypothetical protein [Gordonia jinghuaiqii]MTB93751.1 hypothetical protein [Nocardioides marmotae]QKE00090.1 hypothetical protein HPC71_02580 [Nocardioides marmotae]
MTDVPARPAFLAPRVASGVGYVGGDTVPLDPLLDPLATVEVAFALGRDLDAGELGLGQVRRAVRYLAVALCASGAGTEASPADFVVGPRRLALDAVSVDGARATIRVDGSAQHGMVGRDAVLALQALAQQCSDAGQPLRAGDVVLSGGPVPACRITPGAHIVGEIDGLGRVAATFADPMAASTRAS